MRCLMRGEGGAADNSSFRVGFKKWDYAGNLCNGNANISPSLILHCHYPHAKYQWKIMQFWHSKQGFLQTPVIQKWFGIYLHKLQPNGSQLVNKTGQLKHNASGYYILNGKWLHLWVTKCFGQYCGELQKKKKNSCRVDKKKVWIGCREWPEFRGTDLNMIKCVKQNWE